MKNPNKCPRSHKGNRFHLKTFHWCMMDVKWIREGVVIVKEGVVSLNNMGIGFHVFRLLLKIAEIAKTLE
jgi:hypothetical protein